MKWRVAIIGTLIVFTGVFLVTLGESQPPPSTSSAVFARILGSSTVYRITKFILPSGSTISGNNATIPNGDNTTIQAPKYGGTGQNSSAWSGIARIVTGTWSALTFDTNGTDSSRVPSSSYMKQWVADNGGALSGNLAGDIALDGNKITGVTEEIIIPIASCIDGTAPPSALATVSVAGGGSIVMKDQARDFSNSAYQDVYCNWSVPFDLGTTTTITFAVQGWVTASTAPAQDEGIAFGLAGFSVGGNETLGGTLGTEVVTTEGFGANWAQNDRFATAYSSAVTLTGIAAGETAIMRFRRVYDNAADTYGQLIGVSRIKIKYQRNIQ